VCEQFAQALGLTYNDTLDLYTFDSNSSRRDDLRSWGLNFTFSIADTSTSSEAVEITLPYNAFDQQLTFPYINNTSYSSDDANKYYFPLRPATNESQYTLGRSFLQEAYMIVDYERNNFSVHQAVHIPNPLSNTSIVDILRPSDSQFSPPPSTPSGLSKAAIAGLVIGILVLVIFLGVLFWFLRKKYQKPRAEIEKGSPDISPSIPAPAPQYAMNGSDLHSPVSLATEVDSLSNKRQEIYTPVTDPMELDASPAAVPRTPRDGTEKVKFSTYQRELFRDRRQPVLAASSSSLGPIEQHLEPPRSGATTPLTSSIPGNPPVQSAAEFLQRMIERKSGNVELDDPPRTRGRRGKGKEPVYYTHQRDSWQPGDDQHIGDTRPDDIRPDESFMSPVTDTGDADDTLIKANLPSDDGEELENRSQSRLSRSESITKTPLSPKVLVLGRMSFKRGRRQGMPG
jgi:hypothetical protein